MTHITPPQILVKTWLYLLSADEEESKLHAKRMLITQTYSLGVNLTSTPKFGYDVSTELGP